MVATVQETPPDHLGGYTFGRDELIVEDTDYNQALAGRRVAVCVLGVTTARAPAR